MRAWPTQCLAASTLRRSCGIEAALHLETIGRAGHTISYGIVVQCVTTYHPEHVKYFSSSERKICNHRADFRIIGHQLLALSGSEC